MNTETHTNKLRKSSGLFFQLGLVLTLTVVYALFEHKTQVKEAIPIDVAANQVDSDVYFNPDVIVIERKITKTEQTQKPTTKFVETFKISDDPEEIETDTPIKPTEFIESEPNDISNDLVYVESEDIPIIEDVDFIKIEDAPIFPGCEKKDKDQRKDCFIKKMDKIIQQKFNPDLANQLGLSSGTKRIYVQFIITKTGEIEILDVRAPHKRLEKEGERVINLLPKMIPGKQRGVPVNVKYMKPIAFYVQ